MSSVNSFGTRTPLAVGGRTYQMFSLPALQRAGFPEIARLPFSLKILLENLLRHEDGRTEAGTRSTVHGRAPSVAPCRLASRARKSRSARKTPTRVDHPRPRPGARPVGQEGIDRSVTNPWR